MYIMKECYNVHVGLHYILSNDHSAYELRLNYQKFKGTCNAEQQ